MLMELGLKRAGKACLDCPRCGHPAETGLAVRYARAPESGDLGICAGCGAILEFLGAGRELSLRMLGQGELDALITREPRLALTLIFAKLAMWGEKARRAARRN